MYQTAIASFTIIDYITLSIFVMGIFMAATAFLNLVMPVSFPRDKPIINDRPKVSLLIPARNESSNIGQLLQDISKLSYPNYEVIVYDDESDDDTAAVVKRYICNDARIHLLEGQRPETDWLGKNYACYQLAQAARGEYLLFLDADVRVSGCVIEKSLQQMYCYKLGLLSVFPMQILDNKGAWLTVPLMNWILLSLLPLILIRWSPWVSFSAANGQFMFFDARIYKKLQPHRTVKNQKVEDIAICRYYKRNKIKVSTLLGNSEIQCRMYSSLKEAIEGFSKNIFAFFGNSLVLSILFGVITTLLPLLLLLIWGWKIAALYAVIVVIKRIIIAAASHQPIFQSIKLIPAQQVIFWLLLIQAYKHRKNKTLTWKGRYIN